MLRLDSSNDLTFTEIATSLLALHHLNIPPIWCTPHSGLTPARKHENITWTDKACLQVTLLPIHHRAACDGLCAPTKIAGGYSDTDLEAQIKFQTFWSTEFILVAKLSLLIVRVQGQYVVAGCAEGVLHVWKWETGVEISHISAHQQRINHCCVLPDAGTPWLTIQHTEWLTDTYFDANALFIYLFISRQEQRRRHRGHDSRHYIWWWYCEALEALPGMCVADLGQRVA